MYSFRSGAAGVVRLAKYFRFEGFADLTTPPAAFRWLRGFCLCRSHPSSARRGINHQLPHTGVLGHPSRGGKPRQRGSGSTARISSETKKADAVTILLRASFEASGCHPYTFYLRRLRLTAFRPAAAARALGLLPPLRLFMSATRASTVSRRFRVPRSVFFAPSEFWAVTFRIW